jgi:hypothetical protein
LGLVAGFIGSKIVNKTGEGILLHILVGTLGAVVVLLAPKDGRQIVENHCDESHFRLKALVHLDVLAGLSAFLSPRS